MTIRGSLGLIDGMQFTSLIDGRRRQLEDLSLVGRAQFRDEC